MDLSNTSGILALGGVAAIIATGWQHIRTALSHLSSLLIVRAQTDVAVCASVSLLLRKEWTLLPSGSVEYHRLWLRLHGDTTTSLVPFKLPPYKSSVYIKGRKVVIFDNNGNISTIRGLCDLDQLISDSVKYRTEMYHAKENEKATKTSRFRIINIIGGEKGAWASGKGRSSSDRGEGHITLEFSNTTPLPAKIYANEGCAQLLFLQADRDDICETSYKDRGGKYMEQRGITLPRP